jgi:hypothetical protein
MLVGGMQKKKDAKAILGRIRNLVGKSSERGRT